MEPDTALWRCEHGASTVLTGRESGPGAGRERREGGESAARDRREDSRKIRRNKFQEQEPRRAFRKSAEVDSCQPVSSLAGSRLLSGSLHVNRYTVPN